MTIREDAEITGMRRAGIAVRDVLQVLEGCVEPGIRTREIDAVCASEMAQRGAEPTPARVLGFPGSLCISVNDEAVHGVPGERRRHLARRPWSGRREVR